MSFLDSMLAAQASMYGSDRSSGASMYGSYSDAITQQALGLLNQQTALQGFQNQYNIADLQGKYGIQGQELQNTGALNVANANNSGAVQVAGINNAGSNYRTGLSENAATGRSVLDNAGADYRSLLGAQTATYAPQLASDRFGYVANNFAAPMLQSLFGIQPGDPYQTRSAPDFSAAPDYVSLLGGYQQANPVPAAPAAPAFTPYGGAAVPQTFSAPAGSMVARRAPSPQAPARPAAPAAPMARPPVSGFAPGAPTAAARAPAAPAAPARPAAPAPGYAPRVAQATGGGSATFNKPLPTSYAGPQVTAGPVYTQAQMGQQVNRLQGQNSAREANANRAVGQQMAGMGFGANSPQAAALRAQNSYVRGFADQEAATQIPWQAAQANAAQRLASETANANLYGQRVNDELQRRQQELSGGQGYLSLILGLAG